MQNRVERVIWGKADIYSEIGGHHLVVEGKRYSFQYLPSAFILSKNAFFVLVGLAKTPNKHIFILGGSRSFLFTVNMRTLGIHTIPVFINHAGAALSMLWS